MTQKPRSLLGRGPSFPYNLSDQGGLAYTDDITRINQSLFILFETPKGDRLMMPEFGSNLYRYKFDPLDRVLMEKIRYTISEDVKRWEPRINLTSIEFLTENSMVDNSILYVSLSYRIINSDVEANYVYPYKLYTYETLKSSFD